MSTKQARQHDNTHSPTTDGSPHHHYQHSDSDNRPHHDSNAGHIPAWVFIIPALILAVAAAIFILNPAENNAPATELLVGDNALASDSAYVQQLPGI